ncbi:MAG: biotin-dependent carboxyltransferase family protein [Rhodocyclaceae bacterium]|nr:biotin-dependent carboxyltransferase family protein [Rhodocyclaceae bacterium]
MSYARIASPGALASLQDEGRFGWRHLGVPWSGALDPQQMHLANALVGNPRGTPVIECFEGGLKLIAEGAGLRVAVAGSARLVISGPEGSRAAASWQAIDLAPDESLGVLACDGDQRCVCVAVFGLSVPLVLGSASTYARAGLGGIAGRTLAAGDRLSAAPTPPSPGLVLPYPPAADEGAIRILPGPQADHFDADALSTLLGTTYTVGAESDRMGLRLTGPALTHRDTASREILSDATVPGNIQVPGNGLPIVLLADAQTAGGYPKIATVISADLPRLATCRPGARLRFAAVDRAAAEQAARDRAAALDVLLASLAPRPIDGSIDPAALLGANLAGEAVNAFDPTDWSPP